MHTHTHLEAADAVERPASVVVQRQHAVRQHGQRQVPPRQPCHASAVPGGLRRPPRLHEEPLVGPVGQR